MKAPDLPEEKRMGSLFPSGIMLCFAVMLLTTSSLDLGGQDTLSASLIPPADPGLPFMGPPEVVIVADSDTGIYSLDCSVDTTTLAWQVDFEEITDHIEHTLTWEEVDFISLSEGEHLLDVRVIDQNEDTAKVSFAFEKVNPDSTGALFRHEVDTKTEGTVLKAVINVPEGYGPFPVIILIHGGAFLNGDRYKYGNSLYFHYLNKGIATIAVEYRLVGEGGTHPTPIRDCLHNLHWLRDHAKEYRFDIRRVGLQGSSAGSYLAMMMGLTGDSIDFQPDFGLYQGLTAGVRAVISSAAMYDWTAIIEGDPYIGDSRDDPEASPVNRAYEGSCQAYMLVGGEDDNSWSPPEAARAMHDSLVAAGRHCELYLKENTNHPTFYGARGDYEIWALERIDPFLDIYLTGDTIEDNVAVEQISAPPAGCIIERAVPNPFSHSTRVEYVTEAVTDVVFSIYDMTGRMVKQIISGKKYPGHHSLYWDGTDQRGQAVSSGMYICRAEFRAPSSLSTQMIRMMLLR